MVNTLQRTFHLTVQVEEIDKFCGSLKIGFGRCDLCGSLFQNIVFSDERNLEVLADEFVNGSCGSYKEVSSKKPKCFVHSVWLEGGCERIPRIDDGRREDLIAIAESRDGKVY